MKLNSLLEQQAVLAKVTADSKKFVLETLSNLLTKGAGVMSSKIFDYLDSREQLGSTAIGHGVAIPHGRVPEIQQPIGGLITLKKPIDFGALDNLPVDIFFALLVPIDAAAEHLNLLAEIATKFGQKAFRNKLRQAKTNQELYQTAIIDN